MTSSQHVRLVAAQRRVKAARVANDMPAMQAALRQLQRVMVSIYGRLAPPK
jgi:hypothetical protein